MTGRNAAAMHRAAHHAARRSSRLARVRSAAPHAQRSTGKVVAREPGHLDTHAFPGDRPEPRVEDRSEQPAPRLVGADVRAAVAEVGAHWPEGPCRVPNTALILYLVCFAPMSA